MTVRLHKELQGEVPAPVRLRREARQAAWDASRTGFPPVRIPSTGRPPISRMSRPWADYPASVHPPEPGHPQHAGPRRGAGAGLACRACPAAPGSSGGWPAAPRTPGPGWKQDCAGWMDARGVHAGNRMDVLSIGLILAVCADIVRPCLPWLAASGVSPWALARNLERTRDQAGFARLREAIGDGASPGRGTARGHRRAAVVMAAKGGTLAEIDLRRLPGAARRRARGPQQDP